MAAAKDRSDDTHRPPTTLDLLWRVGEPAVRRGPRKALSVDAVVAAAIALADDEGLDAVTMRRVAQSLGVAPMTLYTYVPGKSELIELMLDALYAGMPRPETPGGWRDRAAAVARENYALYRAHPWAAAAAPTRPVLGPGAIGKYEYELGAFEGIGLADVAMDDALAYLLGFVQSAARAAADAEAQREQSGQTDREWWEANAPLLERVLDAERYPLAARVGQAAGAAHGTAYDPDHAFTFGLARALDGLAALIERS